MKIVLRMIVRVLLAIVMMSSGNRGEAASPADPSGTWLVEDGRARVRLERCGPARDHICGYIVWMKNPVDARGEPYRDDQNPDPDKRARALLGHQLLMGLEATPDGRFAGDIYKLYSVSLWRESAEAQGLSDQAAMPDPDLAADGRRPGRTARRPYRRSERPACRQGMGGRAGCEGDASEGEVSAPANANTTPDLLVENATQPGRLRRNLMNALQIIPPKPVVGARRSALRLRVSDAILLLALIGGMSMSRGEEGTASAPGAAVVSKDSQDKVGDDKAGDNDKSASVTQPAAVSAGATTQVSGTGGDDEKMSASAPSAALSATPAPAGVRNDPKVGSDAREAAAAEAKSDTAIRAEIKDRDANDRDGSRVLANLSQTSSASAARNDRVSKSEDGRVRKTAANTMAVRSAEAARRANQPRSEADYRSRKAADGVPVWAGPPPIIYGSGADARAPHVAVPADAMKSQDRASSAVTGTWERVVDAPVAVLDGGKQALYGILDSLW
jgi:hypothetical protein